MAYDDSKPVKIVFPDIVERELAQQQSQQQVVHKTDNASTQTEKSPENQLSEAQIKARQQAINNTTSKLYQPEFPLTPKYRSKSKEIEERLASIQKRFHALKAKEDARNAELQRQAWLKFHSLSKPTLKDFKRPLTSFFLLASGVYISLQYTWYALERENFVDRKQAEQEILVNSLNEALLNQQIVIDQYNNGSSSGYRKWWKFW